MIRKVILTKIAMFLCAISLLQPIEVLAAFYNVTPTSITVDGVFKVENVKIGSANCTNPGGMVFVGNTAYILKTDGNDSCSVLMEYQNYNSSTRKLITHKIVDKKGAVTSIGHGGGLTYYNGNFYTPNGNKIHEINKKGVIQKTYTVTGLKGPSSISHITYCRSGNFIVASPKNYAETSAGVKCSQELKNKPYRVFYTAILEGNNFVIKKKFFVPIAFSDNKAHLSQDFTYRKFNGKGYLIFPSYDTVSRRMSVIDMVDISETIKDKQVYNPVKRLRTKAKTATFYEVESIDVGPDGKMYLVANRNVEHGGDALFRVNY